MTSRFLTQMLSQTLYRPSTLRWMTSLDTVSLPLAYPHNGETMTPLGRWKKVTPAQLERRIDLAITDNCIGSYAGRSSSS